MTMIRAVVVVLFALSSADAATCPTATASMLTALPIFGGTISVQWRNGLATAQIGNSACAGSYGLIAAGVTTKSTTTNSYFWSYGMVRSPSVFACYLIGTASSNCTLALTTGVAVPSIAPKSALLTSKSGPPLAFALEPAHPAAGTAFNITVTGSWASAKSFGFALGGTGVCSGPLRTWNTSLLTAKVLNTTAVLLEVDAAATSVGVADPAAFVALPLCARIQSTAELGGWFALSHFAGHSNHNILLGSSSNVAAHTSADLAWSMPAALSVDYLAKSEYHAFGAPFDVVLDAGWLAARSFTQFAFDATMDLCHPELLTSFTISDVVPVNATHGAVYGVHVDLPPPSPGGGRAVLCGAVNSTSPWILLSYSSYNFRQCAFGDGYVPYAGCIPCGPSTTDYACSRHGTCGAGDEVLDVYFLNCICDRGYSGQNCGVRNSLTSELSISETLTPSITGTATQTISASVTAASDTPPSTATKIQSLSMSCVRTTSLVPNVTVSSSNSSVKTLTMSVETSRTRHSLTLSMTRPEPTVSESATFRGSASFSLVTDSASVTPVTAAPSLTMPTIQITRSLCPASLSSTPDVTSSHIRNTETVTSSNAPKSESSPLEPTRTRTSKREQPWKLFLTPTVITFHDERRPWTHNGPRPQRVPTQYVVRTEKVIIWRNVWMHVIVYIVVLTLCYFIMTC